MRDVLIITPTEEGATWNLDIDIIDGFPGYVFTEENTQDQRAAIAAYTTLGSIPGALGEGVDWSALYTGQNSLISVDNEVQQNISNLASSSDNASNSYTPLYLQRGDKGISFLIYKAGVQ